MKGIARFAHHHLTHSLQVEFKEQHLDDFLHLDIILSHAREGCRPVVLEIVGPNQLTVTPQEQ